MLIADYGYFFFQSIKGGRQMSLMKSLSQKTFLFLFPVFLFTLTSFNTAQAQKPIRTADNKTLSVSKAQDLVKLKERRMFLAPTQTQIWIWTGHEKEMMNFVPEFFISDHRTDLNWRFQWSTRQKGSVHAIYQISIFPFNNTGSAWQNPPGLVQSGSVGKIRTDGTKLIFNLDITGLTQPAASQNTRYLPPRKTQPRKLNTAGQSNKPQIQPKSTRSGLQATPKNQIGRSVNRSAKPDFPILTYYIRIVTLDANNKMIGTPSKASIFHYGRQTESVVNWYTDPNKAQPPQQDKINNPVFKILEYRPFHDYRPDWPYRFIITKEMNFIGLQYHKGQKVYWPPASGSDSVWDKISDAFGSLIEFVKNGVNAISEKYSAIKNSVLKFAINLVPGCGAYPPCQTGLAFAMDYGLAAIGLPPSVPNFDDLKAMGKDYLIQYAAEQSGLPVEDAVKVIEKYMTEIDNTASAGGWYKLDTSYQYSDAMLLLEVSNPTGKSTDPAVLTLKQFERLFLFSGGNGKFKYIPIPSLKPGQKIVVPVMLAPNTMQYTPGASMLQSDWNKLAQKGVLLELFGDYGDNLPNKDQMVVRNSAIKR